MDARSLFAILAIVLLFWLLFSWLRWDSRARLARLSRQRLRERLFELDPSQRAGKPERAERTGTAAIVAQASARSVNQRYSGAESGAFEGGAYRGSNEAQSEASENQLAGVSNANPSTDAATLAEQVQRAQQQAAASQQNDLELRRLNSELQSREAQGANDSEGVELLQQRLHEQQANLDAADTRASDRNGEFATNATATDASATDASAQSSSATAKDQSTKAPDEVLLPIFQAPSYKDDLKKINGIGPVMERTLNALGVTTFKQVAEFTQEDIDKVSQAIGAFPGRIERDDWVGKARKILQSDERLA